MITALYTLSVGGREMGGLVIKNVHLGTNESFRMHESVVVDTFNRIGVSIDDYQCNVKIAISSFEIYRMNFLLSLSLSLDVYDYFSFCF